MRKEAHIPLFLWVATALVVHGLGGGGATQVVHHIEQTELLESFASQVKRHAASTTRGMEVTLYEDEPTQVEAEPPEPEQPPEAETEQTTDDEVETPPEPAEPRRQESEKVIEKPEPKKEPTAELPDLQIQRPVPVDNRRVAVDQQVDDENQDDNPDAEFAADQANHVDQQTRARVTASDGSVSRPELGGPSVDAGDEAGNADRSELGQSSEAPGRDDVIAEAPSAPPTPASSREPARPPTRESAAQASASAKAPTSPSTPATAQPRQAQEARDAQTAQSPMAETLTADGGSSEIARAREERAQSAAQRAQARILEGKQKRPQPMLGLGSGSTTERGINLNLSFAQAHDIVGADTMQRLKTQNGERRLSQHRGKWQSLGLERWKPALENYVANVQPGNQTALNTARVPFARYLNQIHQRLHEVFAHDFLGHLDQLPQDHPLNNQEMSTHLEIALSPADGKVVRMGVTKSSGVTAFDVGALDSVQRAAPYGPPPASIVSSDGNVYLHWEFHRKPMYACSTYFARPYIIDLGQKSAPPRVEPPRPPDEEKPPNPPQNKSGSNERELGETSTKG